MKNSKSTETRTAAEKAAETRKANAERKALLVDRLVAGETLTGDELRFLKGETKPGSGKPRYNRSLSVADFFRTVPEKPVTVSEIVSGADEIYRKEYPEKSENEKESRYIVGVLLPVLIDFGIIEKSGEGEETVYTFIDE